MRLLITGWPKTGKTTLSRSLGGGRSTDSTGLSWSDASAEVAKWFDQPGPWIIEGVAVPRAVRKWLANNPGKQLPVDKIVYLKKLYVPPTNGQMAMGKGLDAVLREIEPKLGVKIDYL